MRLGPLGAGLPVRGQKRQHLLVALLEAQWRGQPEVTRLALMDALYPGAGEAQARASLRELIHQTRASFGPGVIQTTPDGYALGAVTSDAALFLEGGDTRLWRGLAPQDAGAGEHGGAMNEALHLALGRHIEAAMCTDPQEAARAARLLLDAEPYDLDILRLALKALRTAGNHRSLSRVYGAAHARLREVGERLPERWSEFLQGQ